MTEKTKKTFHSNQAVTLFMHEVTARVVAKSGIPSDRFHLGKIILQSLQDDPDFVLQIDGGLDVSETNGSVLERSIRCAVALREMGLKCGDVMVLMAPNHIDLAIAYYAALYLGVIFAGVNVDLRVLELKDTFDVNQPKVVFCQNNKAPAVSEALKQSNTNACVVTFDKGSEFTHFADLLRNVKDAEVKNFKPTDFDAEETISLLTATSGTTGLPKSAALTHKNLAIALPAFHSRFYDFPHPTDRFLFISPIYWLSAAVTFTMSPILRYTRLQTSLAATKEHIYDVINTYRPTAFLTSPTLMTTLISPPDCDRCDFSCFEIIVLGGSAVTQDVLDRTKSLAPQSDVSIAYGLSEIGGVSHIWDKEVPHGSVGRPVGYLRHRLINVDTLEDIEEPNVVGELWIKGPAVFKGYYKNTKATKEVFSEDGWLKTGDLLYRDQYHHYMFVDRLKMLLKYRNHQISPAEVEQVIAAHPSVVEVGVVGIPDKECGDLPAAAVVLRRGCTVPAQEIKDWVKERLAETKQLRGGVVFLDQLPLTPSTKVDRIKLKKMVNEMDRK